MLTARGTQVTLLWLEVIFPYTQRNTPIQDGELSPPTTLYPEARVLINSAVVTRTHAQERLQVQLVIILLTGTEPVRSNYVTISSPTRPPSPNLMYSYFHAVT